MPEILPSGTSLNDGEDGCSQPNGGRHTEIELFIFLVLTRPKSK
jgi:hypothetical protein